MDVPLLHQRIIERAIELRARHHDGMEPVSSSGVTQVKTRVSWVKSDSGKHAPVMDVPRIGQRDNTLLH